MVSHPLTTGALFLVVGMLYERRHTREIGGVRRHLEGRRRCSAALFLIALFAGIGLPGFSGFIGEFLSLLGTFIVRPAVRDRRHVRRDPRRGLHAVGVPARVHRRAAGRERARCTTSTLREVRRGRAAARAQPVPRPLPEAGARPRRADGRSAPCTTSSARATTASRSRRRSRTQIEGRGQADADDGEGGEVIVAVVTDRSRRRTSTGWRSRRSSRSAAPRSSSSCCEALLRRRPGATTAALRRSPSLGVITAGGMLLWQWSDVQRPRPDHHDERAWCASTASACSSASSCVVGDRARAAARRSATSRREQLEAPEYVALLLFSGARHAHDDDRQRPHRRVPRARDPLDPALRARRVRPPPAQLAGSRHQVLRARRVLLGDLPLRHRARLRRHRHHLAHRHRRRSSRTNTLFEQGTLLAGLVLLLVGLGFKVAAVPFHMWTPDVYQGAPDAGHRVHGVGHEGGRRSPRCSASSTARSRCTATDWRPVVWALAVLTLLGRQHRRAACRPTSSGCSRTRRSPTPATCSSALEAGDRRRAARRRSSTCSSTRSWSIGSFAVVTVLGDARRRRPPDRRLPRPGARADRCSAACSCFFLLAQAGIPLTGGFIAKLEVFAAAADAREYALVVDRRGRHGGRRVRLPAGGARGRDADAERRRGRPSGSRRPPGRRRHVDRARGHRRRDARARHRARGVRRTGPRTPRSSCTSSPGSADASAARSTPTSSSDQ